MNENEYIAAIAEIKLLWNTPPDTPEGDRLGALLDEVMTYEDMHYPIHDTEFPMDNLD